MMESRNLEEEKIIKEKKQLVPQLKAKIIDQKWKMKKLKTEYLEI